MVKLYKTRDYLCNVTKKLRDNFRTRCSTVWRSRLLALLWAFTVLSFSLTAGTMSRFSSAAVSGSTGRLAIWDVGEKRGSAEDSSDAVLVIFKPASTVAQRTTTITLVNNSEVTAQYMLTATVDEVEGSTDEGDLEDFLASLVIKHKGGSLDGTNYNPLTGVKLPIGPSQAKLDVTIPAVNFKGLEIAAVAVQVD
jgi:hypothetical protein